jgi:hypothetical protein
MASRRLGRARGRSPRRSARTREGHTYARHTQTEARDAWRASVSGAAVCEPTPAVTHGIGKTSAYRRAGASPPDSATPLNAPAPTLPTGAAERTLR